MLALFKEIVGAVPVAKIIELPRLACGAPALQCVQIDQNFDAKVAGKVACVGVPPARLPTSVCLRASG